MIRAADLVLAPLQGELRLVGVDVSAASLLRRVGRPGALAHRPNAERVIDWAAIQPLGDAEGRLGGKRLRDSAHALHALHPGELAHLLEELGRNQRQQLLDTFDPAAAAEEK
jgi:hypothetical protein